MPSFNRVVIVGNLTRDPDLRYSPSGIPVCEITLAINEKRKTSAGEWVEDAVFVDVRFWNKTAEVCNGYCSKGSPLLVEGRLKLDQWEYDGKKYSKLHVIGEKIQFLGGSRNQNAPETASNATRDNSHAPNFWNGADFSGNDNIPF